MVRKIFFWFFILLLNRSIFAEVPLEVHVKNLSTGTDSEKIVACNYLGKEKSEKKYISEIESIVKNTVNSKVAIACANALGYLQVNGSPTTTLKNKIMSESNSDVIYTCLLAILNIALKNGYEPDAKIAIQYSDINHRQDEFVADLIDRIKNKFKE